MSVNISHQYQEVFLCLSLPILTTEGYGYLCAYHTYLIKDDNSSI